VYKVSHQSHHRNTLLLFLMLRVKVQDRLNNAEIQEKGHIDHTVATRNMANVVRIVTHLIKQLRVKTDTTKMTTTIMSAMFKRV
jgi:hypothetical protein